MSSSSSCGAKRESFAEVGSWTLVGRKILMRNLVVDCVFMSQPVCITRCITKRLAVFKHRAVL